MQKFDVQNKGLFYTDKSIETSVNFVEYEMSLKSDRALFMKIIMKPEDLTTND